MCMGSGTASCASCQIHTSLAETFVNVLLSSCAPPRLCCRQASQYVREAMREATAKAMQAGTHLAFCKLAPMAACSPMPCCPGMRG